MPRFETPNATMDRFDGETVAVWRTEMAPGATGPLHVIDVEQVVVVVAGVLAAEVAGSTSVVETGGSLVLPAGAARRLRNGGDGPLVTLTAGLPGATARVGDQEPVAVPWAA